MIDQAAIVRAFRNRLLDLPTVPDPNTRIAWENVAFEVPDLSEIWLREKVLWLSEVLRPFDVLEAMGTVDYDVFVPDASSTEEGQAMARTLSFWFTPSLPNSLPVASGYRLAIVRSETLTGRTTDVNSQTWYQIPFKMTFKAWGPAGS